MDDLAEQVRALNDTLDRCKIYVKRDRLYIRGTFPPKAGEQAPKQREIATGNRVTARTIKAAYSQAQRIDSDLMFNRFDWADWERQKRPNQDTLAAACAKFEQDFFDRKGRSPGQIEYFQIQYGSAFSRLPLEQKPSCELLKAALVELAVDQRKRKHDAIAYGALARFIGLDCDLSPYKGTYRGPEKRELPPDDLILQYREQLFNREVGLRKAFELIALYGFRPHELYRLDFVDFELEGFPIRVKSDSKTGERVAFPLPPQWAQDWNLKENLCIPHLCTVGLSNRQLGQHITQFFKNQRKRHGWKITATILRDMFAVRAAVMGIDSAIAARWMGHSLEMHAKTYLSHISWREEQAIWCKLKS